MFPIIKTIGLLIFINILSVHQNFIQQIVYAKSTHSMIKCVEANIKQLPKKEKKFDEIYQYLQANFSVINSEDFNSNLKILHEIINEYDIKIGKAMICYENALDEIMERNNIDFLLKEKLRSIHSEILDFCKIEKKMKNILLCAEKEKNFNNKQKELISLNSYLNTHLNNTLLTDQFRSIKNIILSIDLLKNNNNVTKNMKRKVKTLNEKSNNYLERIKVIKQKFLEFIIILKSLGISCKVSSKQETNNLPKKINTISSKRCKELNKLKKQAIIYRKALTELIAKSQYLGKVKNVSSNLLVSSQKIEKAFLLSDEIKYLLTSIEYNFSEIQSILKNLNNILYTINKSGKNYENLEENRKLEEAWHKTKVLSKKLEFLNTYNRFQQALNEHDIHFLKVKKLIRDFKLKINGLDQKCPIFLPIFKQKHIDCQNTYTVFNQSLKSFSEKVRVLIDEKKSININLQNLSLVRQDILNRYGLLKEK